MYGRNSSFRIYFLFFAHHFFYEYNACDRNRGHSVSLVSHSISFCTLFCVYLLHVDSVRFISFENRLNVNVKSDDLMILFTPFFFNIFCFVVVVGFGSSLWHALFIYLPIKIIDHCIIIELLLKQKKTLT